MILFRHFDNVAMEKANYINCGKIRVKQHQTFSQAHQYIFTQNNVFILYFSNNETIFRLLNFWFMAISNMLLE